MAATVIQFTATTRPGKSRSIPGSFPKNFTLKLGKESGVHLCERGSMPSTATCCCETLLAKLHSEAVVKEAMIGVEEGTDMVDVLEMG